MHRNVKRRRDRKRAGKAAKRPIFAKMGVSVCCTAKTSTRRDMRLIVVAARFSAEGQHTCDRIRSEEDLEATVSM